MKLIITSVDALYDEVNQKPYDGIFEALDSFRAEDEGNEIIVASIHQERLKSIPDKYNPIHVKAKFRRTELIKEVLEAVPQYSYSDVLVLGAKYDDLILASNEKVPLLVAKYTNLPENVIGNLYDYGVPISSPEALKEYLTSFLKIQNPWFYSLNIDEKTSLHSLTNAQTFYQSGDIVNLKNHFQDCLKRGNPKYRDLFKAYFLMSCYSDTIINELKGVDYWGIYPSSGKELNQDLDFFKEIVRTSFNGGPRRTKNINGLEQQLLHRIEAVNKRHFNKEAERLSDGCSEQLRTIRINPRFRDRIPGSSICIIDDFTRYGTSCETVRHLLKKAGVNKIVFLTMGKFGKDYYKYDYTINGNALNEFTAIKNGNPVQIDSYGLYNNNSNSTFLNSLKSLL